MIALLSGVPHCGKSEGALRVLVELARRCETSLRVAHVSDAMGDSDVADLANQEAEACSISAFEVARYYA